MKNIILLWLMVGWSFLTSAQIATITDQETGDPLEFATLISADPKVTVTSNQQGQVDVSSMKGSEKIQILSYGYKAIFLSYVEIEAMDFTVALEASSLNFDEVIISSTRWKETSNKVPSKIATISPKEIALINPQTAADLLSISGKVFVQKSQQGGGSPMIRGFATNRLLYTVDGVRMNTAIFRGGNIQNVINIDPFATEDAEVLFGPGSVIYGSDAIGGVMSFQTIRPKLSLNDKTHISGKAVTRYSSANNEKAGHFDVNVGWKKWAVVTSFSAWDFDHLKQGKYGPDAYIKDYYVQRQDTVDVVIKQDDPLLQVPSAYAQMNLMQKIRFSPNKKWDIEYGFHYSETSQYGRYDRHNRVKNGTARYAEWNYGPQSWMMNLLSVTHKGDNVMYSQLSLRIAQQSFEESRIDRSFNKNDRTTNTEHVEAYSANLDLIKYIGKKNTLHYGLEYVLNDVTSEGMITDITTGVHSVGASRYPNATWTSMAVYINDVFAISDKFTLQAGLRYNQFTLSADFSDNLAFYPFDFSSAEFNSGSLTGSLGGVYQPVKNWVITINGGTAFRSPNVDDIGRIFDSEPGAVTVPNPDLAAEYAYNIDFGIAKRFGDVVEINATGYYTILQNAMVRRDYQLNGLDSIMYDGQLSQVQAIQNAATANVYGIQAGIKIQLSAGFSITSDFNYQFGEEELEDGSISASRHAAPMFGTTRLSYIKDHLTLQFYANYQGKRSFEDLPVSEQSKDEIYAKDNDGNNYAPSWYTLNVKALYGLTEHFLLSAGVENITNQRYRPYSSGLSGAGRNFVFAVTFKF